MEMEGRKKKKKKKKKKWRGMKMNMLMVSIREKCRKALGKRCAQQVMSDAPQQEEEEEVIMAPEGCFWVYVGPERQRFPVKIELARHPLFKLLLEEAETVYGFGGEGPIRLPCEVAVFCQVLAEMDSDDDDDDDDGKETMLGWCSPLRVGSPSGLRHGRSSASSYKLLRGLHQASTLNKRIQ